MPDRPPRTHIFLIDGTFSRLDEGRETNVGLTYRLLEEVGQTMGQTVGYHPGVQGTGLKKWLHAAAGIGINDAMIEAYATLASRYKPGDRIVLMGFSRGAYAVRSVAGWIGRLGLLKAQHATERRVRRAFRHYEGVSLSHAGRRFAEKYCHQDICIEMIGVWDTVSALGIPYPVLNRLAPMATEFHDHMIGRNVRHAFQALAIDETRVAYDPVCWDPAPDWPGVMEQVWFPGAHADIGGHAARGDRGVSNIPLVWMLERLSACGVALPDEWQGRFAQDAAARAIGNIRGHGWLFIFRTPRLVRQTAHESIHISVYDRMRLRRRYRPKAEVSGTTRTSELRPARLTP